jgi:hypothetical protein
MRGGGQASSTVGTIDEIVIKRGDKVVWGASDVQTALSGGMTILDLDLQAGDDVVFAASASTSQMWKTILPYTTTLLGLVLLFIRRR